jgi:hypothetical protein
MRLFAEFFSLTDRYERKARLLPGLLLAAGPALTAGAVLQSFAAWYTTASASIGIEFLVAIIAGHFARARGRRIEDGLWTSWGGAPTVRWLRPWDQTCSDQQKSKWRGAIKRLTGLTVPASIPQGGSQDDVDRHIADATRQLRYTLRGKPEAAMVATHNEDYGFARNLCAIRWHWIVLSLACLLGCGVALALGMRPYLGLGIAGGFSIASVFIAIELPDYVRRCADRYSESLFATAILVSQGMDEAEKHAHNTTVKEHS